MKIELTDKDLAIIGNALAQRPYGEVAGVIQSIAAQLAKPKTPLEQCVASGQVEADQVVAHQSAG